MASIRSVSWARVDSVMTHVSSPKDRSGGTQCATTCVANLLPRSPRCTQRLSVW